MEQHNALLVLDVDECLVYACKEPLPDRRIDFRSGEYIVYKRPYLDEFLLSVAELYRIALWSSSTFDYVSFIRWRIMPRGVSPLFVWGRTTSLRRDPETDEMYYIKDLAKTKRFGFGLSRTLLVEDTPANASRNYGNAIYVRKYKGAPDDDELRLLSAYLKKLHSAPDFRKVEKRGWRCHTTNDAS